MAEPKADRRYVDEAQEAFNGLVVACGHSSGALRIFDATYHNVAQSVERAVDRHKWLPRSVQRDCRHDLARFHGFANVVRAIVPVCE